jgi:hypothetical protein
MPVLAVCPECSAAWEPGSAGCGVCGSIPPGEPGEPGEAGAGPGSDLERREVVIRLSTGEDAVERLQEAHRSHDVRVRLSTLVVDATALFRAERSRRLGVHAPGEADVAPLVRRLTAMQHALLGLADDLKAAAGVCQEEIAAEREAVTGPRRVGYLGPLRTVRIPDGDKDIVIADKTSTSTSFHDGAVIAVLADVATRKVVADFGEMPGASVVIERAARAGALAALREAAPMLSGGRFSWKSTSVDGLRKRLMAESRDVEAGALERAKVVEKKATGDVTVSYADPTGRTR